MQKRIFLFSIFIISSVITKSQAPNIQWEKCLGGSNADKAYSIANTFDGGYIVAGFSSSIDGDVTLNNGKDDYWIVKLDSNGNIKWQKSFGGSEVDNATSIIQTIDGGFAVAGYSYSSNGDVSNHHGGSTYSDYWIIKLDSTGNLQWEKSYGGSLEDQANSIIQTIDGGFAIAGYASSSDGDVVGSIGGITYWILKLDLNGNIEWQKPLGGSWLDWGQDIFQTTDGGYVVAGYSSSNDYDVTGNHSSFINDAWIVKLDGLGNIQWEKCFGGSQSDGALTIIQTLDGGYAFAGQTQSDDGDVIDHHHVEDLWVLKLDSNGTLLWQRSLGGFENEAGSSIIETSDGGLVVAGATASSDGDVSSIHQNYYYTEDYWVLKLDEQGNLLWEKTFGGFDVDIAYSIVQTNDGGYAIAGLTHSFDGDVTDNNGSQDYWIIKLYADVTGIAEQLSDVTFSLFPNPATTSFQLNYSITEPTPLTITDALGRIVKVVMLDAAATQIIISTADMGAGIYFLQIKMNEETTVLKVVVQ